MNKFSLGATILILSSAWTLAQVSTPPTDENPTSSAQSAQQPDKSQTAPSDKSAQAIEGCLSGSANVFKLTDATGKTYELTGDTSMLADNVGHQVSLWGHAGSSGGGEKISAAGPQATFGVEKVKSLSDTCK